jgi:fatty acid desaturase
MLMSYTAVTSGGWTWGLVPPGWLLTVSAMRTVQTSFVHHAAHGNFLQPKWLGDLVAEALSVVLWIQPLWGYRPDHVLHHGQTATSQDADLRLLVEFGFRPGLGRLEYWWQFWRMLVSPSFHATYAKHRFRANFKIAPSRRWGSVIRLIFVILWIVALVSIMAATGSFWTWFVVWLLPVGPLYQMAGLAQLITEHNWVRVGDLQGDTQKVILGRLTRARFFGESVPQSGAGYLAWAGWWLRMLMVHLPQRLLVASGDLPNHDWHHRRTHGDWANAAYGRRDDALEDQGNWPPYSEHWGFVAAAEETFGLLGSLPATAKLGDPLTYSETEDGYLGM